MSKPVITPENPSRRALARVENPIAIPTHCPNCGCDVQLARNRIVYKKDYGEWPYLYLCINRACDSYVGLHPYTNLPLGTLANGPTRSARKLAKSIFNPLWQNGVFTRTEAYTKLAADMGLPRSECHFGLFTIEQCEAAVRICLNWSRLP